MATAGMRVLVLAALAVGLLAAAVSGARDAMKVARGLVPTDGGGGGVAGGAAAGQQRKGARILAAETFAHHAPLPDYLDHIPRRQALATCTCCYPSSPSLPCLGSLGLVFLSSHRAFLLPFPLISLLPFPLISLLPLALISLLPFRLICCSPWLSFLCSPWLSFLCSPFVSSAAPLGSHFSAPLGSHFSAPLSVWAHDGDDPLAVPYDLHNDIYNMTFYNGCAYNVTSPLRVWQCFNFYNIWEGVLDNPAPNPTQYQQGEIFVQTLPGYCEMRMNRGASGTLQMLPGETVNIVYAHLWDFRPCVQELRFGNGNSYSMTNTTECQLAKVI
ncbi:unnamed protein product [Closterium sp. Naga37s-1]|nr:unnamed protein product [Closterium sp. Naga37s-1]